MTDRATLTAQRLHELVERRWPDLAGPDPYDGLNSPLLRRAANGHRRLRIAALQVVRHLPWDVRPWLGIAPHTNPKTVSLMARAELRLAQRGGPESAAAARRARAWLDWLTEHATPGFSGAAWGYSFAWQSRRLWLDVGQPSAVCTAFVARAFLDAYAAWSEPSDRAVARSAAEFLLRDCPRSSGPRGIGQCISYVPGALVPVHNANLLAASILARVWQAGGCTEDTLRTVAEDALRFSLAEQRRDGSWPYDADASGRTSFVDGFHTGLVLECLAEIGQALGCDVAPALERGLDFYRRQLIAPDGRPRRRLGGQMPTDIRDCAQALLVLGRVAGRAPDVRAQRAAVLDWTLAHMLHPDGYLVFESSPLLNRFSTSMPRLLNRFSRGPAFPRWQAWMLLALLDGPS